MKIMYERLQFTTQNITYRYITTEAQAFQDAPRISKMKREIKPDLRSFNRN
jgi:hypothetical protein